MLLYMRRLILATLALCALAGEGCEAHPQDIGNNIGRSGVYPDKNGNFNVFFIPAYRLTANKTTKAPAPPSRVTTVLGFDPKTSAKIVPVQNISAPLQTIIPVRITSLGNLRLPVNTVPIPSAQLVQKSEGSTSSSKQTDPPPQNHKAHILVTVTTPASYIPAPGSGPSYGPQQYPIPGISHQYNNYPAVPVPAHYQTSPLASVLPVPYYGPYTPAAPYTPYRQNPIAQTSVTVEGRGGSGNIPVPSQVSAAASVVDVVSSSPIGVTPIVGTTGPIYATPDKPASTISQAQESTIAASTVITTPQPETASPSSTTSVSTAASALSSPPSNATNATPIKQSFELSTANQRHQLNITGQVEVVSTSVNNEPAPTAGGAETFSGQITQSTTPASETSKVLNMPAPTPASDRLPATPQQPGVFQDSQGYTSGGYGPTDISRYNSQAPIPPTQNEQYAQWNRFPNGFGQGTNPFAFNNHPSLNGRYFPFYDNLIPGFAPGYPFGVSPAHGVPNPNGYPLQTDHFPPRNRDVPSARPQQAFQNYPTGPEGEDGTGANREGQLLKQQAPQQAPPTGPGQDYNRVIQNPQFFNQFIDPRRFQLGNAAYPQSPGVGFATPAPFVQPFGLNGYQNPGAGPAPRLVSQQATHPEGPQIDPTPTGPTGSSQVVGPTATGPVDWRSQPLLQAQQVSPFGPGPAGAPYGISSAYYPNTALKSDIEVGQTQISGFGGNPQKLISTTYDVKSDDAIHGVLGGVVGAIAATHRLARREDSANQTPNIQVGFYGGAKK